MRLRTMFAGSTGNRLGLGVALFLSACSSSEGGDAKPSQDSTPSEVAAAGGDTKVLEDLGLRETTTTECLGLSLEECEAAEHCHPLSGSPLQEGCTWGATEYAGCWTGTAIEDGELVAFSCETIPGYAHPPDQPDGWYVFPEFCVPDGWVSSEEPPCTVEPEPDVQEGEESGCHLDCFGGLECWGGVMHAAVSEPLPCSEDSCFKGGPKWPCLSGV
ncbi:MAG: hypothetical protein FJ109_08815 [Deltaproteobacteria bacterium]|nr:hypothetical protein [Deltaproteobacteria bacterium]